MARPTKTRPPAGRAPEPTPKKRPGRPARTQTAVASAPRTKTVAAAKRPASRKPATRAAPKMNKAELEAQIVKLERSLARLRKQNSELKQAARENVAPAPAASAGETPDRAKASRAQRPGRRGSAQQALPPDTGSAAAAADDTVVPEIAPEIAPDTLPEGVPDAAPEGVAGAKRRRASAKARAAKAEPQNSAPPDDAADGTPSGD